MGRNFHLREVDKSRVAGSCDCDMRRFSRLGSLQSECARCPFAETVLVLLVCAVARDSWDHSGSRFAILWMLD